MWDEYLCVWVRHACATKMAIKVIEVWGLGFCLGNALKYICRADKKGNDVEDLKKAAWYLSREIERRERG